MLDCVANTGAFGTQVVLGESLHHLGFGEYSFHEALPHAVPAMCFAG